LPFCLVRADTSKQLGKRSNARIILIVQSSLNKVPKPQLEKKIKIMFAEPKNISFAVSSLIFIFEKFTIKTSTLEGVVEKKFADTN
jgi:hypothetical protein